MRILRFFWWLIVPLGLLGVYLVWGMPYLNASYEFRDDGQGFDPWATRYYTSCTYWNPWDSTTVYPLDGHCPRIRFFKRNTGAN